jgi:hypothetical protein
MSEAGGLAANQSGQALETLEACWPGGSRLAGLAQGSVGRLAKVRRLFQGVWALSHSRWHSLLCWPAPRHITQVGFVARNCR